MDSTFFYLYVPLIYIFVFSFCTVDRERDHTGGRIRKDRDGANLLLESFTGLTYMYYQIIGQKFWISKIACDSNGTFTDKNGGGQILFSEFIDWALARHLHVEDGPE